jgi:hypothetical protein
MHGIAWPRPWAVHTSPSVVDGPASGMLFLTGAATSAAMSAMPGTFIMKTTDTQLAHPYAHTDAHAVHAHGN